VAEKHYKIAVELDSNDSVAANMYGKFLCLNGREAESEKYFLRAVDNSLYKTPEIAYTNAALCVLKMNQKVKAKTYFERALSAKSNFVIALIEMSALELSEGNFATAKIYIDRFHLVDRPTARSLWLEIRSELGINGGSNVKELGQKLESEFPNSVELKSWLALK
jgi:type IV pilus assembly protein PilF